MPANNNPIFTLTPNCPTASIAAANTASDGSGTLVTLFTAGPNGSMLFRIRYHNAQITAAASSAMVVRVFLTDPSGNNPRLIEEFEVPTKTRSTTVVGAGGSFTFPEGGLALASGQIIKVIQSVYAGAQDLMHYNAEGGDF